MSRPASSQTLTMTSRRPNCRVTSQARTNVPNMASAAERRPEYLSILAVGRRMSTKSSRTRTTMLRRGGGGADRGSQRSRSGRRPSTQRRTTDVRTRSGDMQRRYAPDGRHVGQDAAGDQEDGDNVVREHLPVVFAPRLDIDDDGLVDVEGEPKGSRATMCRQSTSGPCSLTGTRLASGRWTRTGRGSRTSRRP